MKRILIPLILMTLLATLTACASTDQPMQTMQPVATLNPTAMPLPNTTDGMTDGATMDEGIGNGTTDGNMGNPAQTTGMPEARGVTTISNARKAMEQIEDELERLSEVRDAQVVVAGNTAAVALRFDRQYQGGVDARMEKMVQERIKGVVSGITNVVVTQDTDVFEQLDKLGDRLEDASDMAAIQSELETLVSKLKQKA